MTWLTSTGTTEHQLNEQKGNDNMSTDPLAMSQTKEITHFSEVLY